MGQQKAVLTTTQEAVELYRALAERSEAAFRSYLALNLNNLGLLQSSLGQREAALVTTQEAVKHCRALAEQSPEAFGPALSGILNNRGDVLHQLGRDAEGDDVMREAESLNAHFAELGRS